mmetsp:Transcript_49751/g.105953  ORF Transcript_49751/g.105953 Transcript_49751/m.105953 type:complete len:206 (-) Transcript_49751:386-1003(-)
MATSWLDKKSRLSSRTLALTAPTASGARDKLEMATHLGFRTTWTSPLRPLSQRRSSRTTSSSSLPSLARWSCSSACSAQLRSAPRTPGPRTTTTTNLPPTTRVRDELLLLLLLLLLLFLLLAAASDWSSSSAYQRKRKRTLPDLPLRSRCPASLVTNCTCLLRQICSFVFRAVGEIALVPCMPIGGQKWSSVSLARPVWTPLNFT